MFDYNTSTKRAYKTRQVAEVYHQSFAGPKTWATLRFRLVAHFERRAVEVLLRQVKARRVLDIPCGTGKLAPVLACSVESITAADVSAEMIDIAKVTYTNAGRDDVSFAIADAEDLIGTFGRGQFDAVICLRLMHRVPSETRRRMLHQIAAIAPYAIVSFGVNSMYFRARRALRSLVFGGGTDPLCTAPLQQIVSEVSQDFDPVRLRWVAPFLSEEVMCLLRRK